MNKPVKHGLDLPNMKTTGLKYNLARKERKCTRELSNDEATVLPSATSQTNPESTPLASDCQHKHVL